MTRPTPRRRASTPLVPRLHVLVRPETPLAVIFRSGPTRTTATFGWNLDTDEIRLGQWVRARIVTFDADHSPDGALLYYEAYDGDNENLQTQGWYRAVSRAPYLKAVKYWAGSRPLRTTRLFDGDGTLRSGTYVKRLVRNGWRVIDEPGGAITLRKPIGPHTAVEKRIDRPDQRGGLAPRRDRHRLIARGGHAIEVDWDWVEVRDGRLLWAARGVLHAGQAIDDDGTIRGDRMLYDFCPLRFARVQAPY